MDNLEIYNLFRSVPDNAKKGIQAGRLKGMTDINPMWRIKCLTEAFGPCGKGWFVTCDKQWLEPGADGEISAFCNISLFVVWPDGTQSMPIHGIGGAKYVSKESKGYYTDDEAFKKAETDAISVACKSLGIGADVYWDKDSTKYSPRPVADYQPAGPDYRKMLIAELKKQNIDAKAFSDAHHLSGCKDPAVFKKCFEELTHGKG